MEIWEKQQRILQDWLLSVGTDPELAMVILQELRAWHFGQSFPVEYPTRLSVAVQLQRDIGWGNALGSWLNIEWRALQHQYYQEKRVETKWVNLAGGLTETILGNFAPVMVTEMRRCMKKKIGLQPSRYSCWTGELEGHTLKPVKQYRAPLMVI